MRVLVTGGAGFIGSHLCEALVRQGNQVFVLDDLSTGRFENIEHIPALTCVIDSTLNQEIVRDLVRDVDVIYHLAATVGVQLVVDDPVRTIINNIRGTETILEETCRYRRRLLITSTSEVYGRGSRKVFQEDDDRVMGPTSLTRWCYAESKAIDEFLALGYWQEKRHPSVIVRLFNTVGPRQTGRYGMVIPRFVRQALCGEPLTVYGDGQQTRCFTYVGDVVPALITLMERKDICGEVFNIGSPQGVTIEALARRVIEKTNSASAIKYVPYDQAYGPGYEDMRHREPGLEKIHQAIGYKPSTMLDAILDAVIADLRDRGPQADAER
ncbi:MAG TPA: GDP-mannose 4,6-dehydratase [Candidatus Hydrogenedentes bacterium]|nr:GDP-mannose 4,6-dehydratase [Candidatus Hydrogenedentota bacterium]HOS02401.1 GDP-mannose 4,6-dehydratase [Candidatus Hydrogenedentota bacterium]